LKLERWLYRGGRPNWLASIVNKFWGAIHRLGVAPDYLVTLEEGDGGPGARSVCR